MFAIWQVMQELGATMEATLNAVKALGLRGRMVRGTRVWTSEEVEALRKHMSGEAKAKS